LFTEVSQDTILLLVKGTAHTRMKAIGGKITVKTSATSDVGRLTKSLKKKKKKKKKLCITNKTDVYLSLLASTIEL